MSIGVWQNKGTVINGTSSEQPSVIFEGNAKILSGNVFKMWYGNGDPGTAPTLNYAESTDGLTWSQYSGNPVVAAAWGSRVYKHGSTYYLYTSTQALDNEISVYTSSDGLTWTLAKSAAITISAASWESAGVGQLNVCAVVSGIWYGYYYGVGAIPNNFYGGLATSTDGINWTKDAGNPVAAFDTGALLDGSTYNGSGNWTFAFANGKYYAWSQTTLFAGSNVELPSDIMRWSSPSPSGPWTPLGVATLPRTIASEGIGIVNGQVADPCILEVAGKTYMFYTADSGASEFAYVINCSIANMTIAALTLTYEGVENVPSPGGLSLNMMTLGSDNFQRADANPIGGNWSQHYDGVGFCAGQLASHLYEAAITSASADSYWNASPFDNDQFSQITVGSVSNGGSFIGFGLREDAGNANTLYRFAWGGANTGGPGTYYMQKYVANSYTTIDTGTITVSDGDVLTGFVIGSSILIYQNESLLFIFTDTDIASGSPGVYAYDGLLVTTGTVAAWSGGNIQSAPPIPPPSSGKNNIAHIGPRFWDWGTPGIGSPATSIVGTNIRTRILG